MKNLTFAILLLAVNASLSAASPLPDSDSELIDIWGSVLYCGAIYEEPDISGRIYEGDRQSCTEARKKVATHVQSSRSLADTRAIFEDASRKAQVIRYNTRSVQEAVTACRELCRIYND
ncbi:hypothetical protein ACFL0N_01595 [Pseudomonadota bacterium]|jgi:hypothetical protein